jgi:hypothetical protein
VATTSAYSTLWSLPTSWSTRPPCRAKQLTTAVPGELMGLPPTGTAVEFTGVSMYQPENGSVAEIWDIRNTLGILHQLNPELGAGGYHH